MIRSARSTPLRNLAVTLAVIAVAACGTPPGSTALPTTPSPSPSPSPSATPAPTATPVDTTVPVLGNAAFTAPSGSGFGTYQPSKIDNGGDPSGRVDSIVWTGWGSPEALGTGTTSIPAVAPAVGYAGPGTAELRATDLGPCTPGGPLAYRHLEARVPTVPGGLFGPWFVWNNSPSICTK